MEYFPHKSLAKLIKKKKKFSEEDTIIVIRRLLKICQYLHARGIVHRYLKSIISSFIIIQYYNG